MQAELEELISMYRNMNDEQKQEFLELARELAEEQPAKDSSA